MFKKKEKKDTASVFFYPSLKNTIVDTFFYFIHCGYRSCHLFWNRYDHE
jgi:hypothetical protein